MVMDKIALTLLVIGGINWGCVGLFQFDLVAFACGGSASLISRIVYTLVGLSAVWCVSLLFRLGDGKKIFLIQPKAGRSCVRQFFCTFFPVWWTKPCNSPPRGGQG